MHSRSILRVMCSAASIAVGLGALNCVRAADAVAISGPVTFDIKPQPLASALNAFAVQSHQQILFTPEVAAGKTTRGIKGTSAPEAALAQVLAGTGLVSSRSADGMVLVSTADAQEASAKSDPPLAPSGATNNPDQRRTERREQAIPAAGLEEIIVTAQKRDERLQDVPVPVTAISAQMLVDTNRLRLEDYYASVPGLNFATDYRGTPQISIRGITTGVNSGNPTVSVTVDDVPFGSSSSYGSNVAPVPDIDPSDLARVEILRGPQGTLYGAASIGGLVKYVTVDPSTDALSGRLETGLSSISNGPQLGYLVRGAVNVPLSDTLALRVSAFTHQDPGYIDNAANGQRGINRVDVDGAHLSALWRPSDAWSVKVSALFQDRKQYGSSEVDPSLGDLRINNIPGTGAFEQKFQAYSATVKGKLGNVDITSVSGYNSTTITDVEDLTPAFGNVLGVDGDRGVDDGRTNKFSQEIRLSASLGERIDWLLGGFYTYENSHFHLLWYGEDPSSGALVGNFLDGTWPTTYEEHAAFTDVTFHMTDQFDVQVGGRESQNRQTYSEIDGGGYGPTFFGVPGPIVTQEEISNANSFTYLVTPRFKFSSDLMLYARLASGYRAGGPNSTAALLGVPTSFKPDTTNNYEMGFKGDVFAQVLSFDASVYYIDWKDIQLQAEAPNNAGTYYTNAGKAKSQGVELSVDAKPLPGLKLGAWVAIGRAVLDEGFPSTAPIYGVAGNRLPYSSRFSGNVSVDQDFSVMSGVTGFVGGSVNYVGDREGEFTSSSQRQIFPSYAQTNLHAGVKYTSWTANLYCNNLTDKRGVLSGGLGTFYPIWYQYTVPRTLGLSIAKTF